MEEIQVQTDNGLSIKIDYIAFTVFSDYTVEDVINLIGFTYDKFYPMPNGAHGYKRMIKHENIAILYDGGENMGIHVDVTGSSVATLFDVYKESLAVSTPFGKGYTLWETTISSFVNDVLKVGHFTRIDLAIDDYGAKYYRLDDIVERVKNSRIVSKWRSCRNLEGMTLNHNTKVGHTIYFGSPTSEIMLRIYDKRLEHNKNLFPDDDNYISYDWVRWELQLRKERADKVAEYLSNGLPLGQVATGVLSDYFRIIVLNDSNRSRCASEDVWEQFIGSVAHLRVTVEKHPKTIEERQKWFEKQHGRMVALLLYKYNGDTNYFNDLGARYECKLTSEDKMQLALETGCSL